jgi:hypothetical protein
VRRVGSLQRFGGKLKSNVSESGIQDGEGRNVKGWRKAHGFAGLRIETEME